MSEVLMSEERFSGFDERELRAALADADPPILLMVYVQLTGDRPFLGAFRPYIRKVRDFADTIPPDLIAELHDRLVGLLTGSTTVAGVELSRDLLKDMMDICVGEPVLEEYMPMLLEELRIEPSDPAEDFAALQPKPGFPADFRVAVIGAGLSGICAAIQLRRAGIEFDVYEKNEAVGGTWWENQYPGCGVDTVNHWYSYSFAMNHDWSRYFVKQGELQAYFEQCVDRFDVRRSIAFETQVVSADYDEAAALWRLVLEDGDGGRRQVAANAVVCGVGQLNNPSIPHMEGIEDFQGLAFHTARWPKGLDLHGKRVALIGTGASGTQVGPAIADEVASLDIYQRSAHWIMKRANYQRAVEPGKKWALRHIPFYARWYRFQLFWAYSDALYQALERDPDWPEQQKSIGPFSESVRLLWNQFLEEELADRPDLLEKSRPKYPPYGKRPLFDNNWFSMLKRDNVGLVQDRIARVTPTGIETVAGEYRDADVIVFATGFHASKMVYSLEVTGRGGRTLKGDWDGDNPRAYLGMTVPGYPNFFLLYGPNTNYAHGGSIAFNAERQAGYIVGCLAEMKARGAAEMEVTRAAYDAYNTVVDEMHSRLVWSVDGLETWYKNERGRVTTNSPFKLLDYWRLTRAPDMDHYDLHAAPALEERS